MYQYYPHDLGFIDVQFRDGTWNLYDPDQDASFWVHVYDADDMVKWVFSLATDVPIIRISTGKFKVEGIVLDNDPSPFAFGVAYYKWYAKKDGVEINMYPVFEFCFEVVEPTTGISLCTLEDLKTHLEIEASGQDPFLTNLVLRGTQFIETYCNRQFMSREFTEYYSGDGTSSIMLPNTPITAVTQIKDDKSGQAGFDYDDTDENDAFSFEEWGKLLLTNGDVFREPSSTYPLRNYKIVYTGGYATAPEDLRQVCMELAAAKFYLKDKQRQGIASKSVAGQTISYRPDDLSPAQKEVLEAYRTIVTGAV
jgi:hypothetical protein